MASSAPGASPAIAAVPTSRAAAAAALLAPPFPWTFIGRLIEDPKNPVLFLADGDRLTIARVGDTLEGGWKVNGMDARSLRVEFVPLAQSQTIPLTAASDTGSSRAAHAPSQAAAASAPMLLQQLQEQRLRNQDQSPGASDRPGEDAAIPTPAEAPASSTVRGSEVSNGIGGVTLQ